MQFTRAVAIPRRIHFGSTNRSSSSMPPSVSAQVAKPTTRPFCSATWVRPSASPSGSSTRCSGWASSRSRSPGLDNDARR